MLVITPTWAWKTIYSFKFDDMQKPKSVTYGIRLLYISTIITAVILLFLYSNLASSVSELFLMVLIPICAGFYFIHLMSKGKFWVRSVFLAGIILDVIKMLLGLLVGSVDLIYVLFLIIPSIALFYLYSGEANQWYSQLLMDETLKNIKHPVE
jgi:hypothetical protein